MTKPYALYQSSICLFPMRKTKTGELEVLLQRRGKKCSFAPNMWEAGVAGHIDDGENSIDAVLHETEEEIGLKLNAKDLIFNTVVEKYVGDKKLTACFIFAYTVFK
jgi:isopentenyldiphosphate isomerase